MKYFASLPTNELLPELEKKIDIFNQYLETSGLERLCKRSTKVYYGEHLGEVGSRTDEIEHMGKDGEYKALSVNHYRNLIKHFLALTITQKPTFDVRARNSDPDALQQAKLFSNVLDSYMFEKRIGRHLAAAAERSLVQLKGYVYGKWNTGKGKQIGTVPAQNAGGEPSLDSDGRQFEKIIYEGDVEFCHKGPFDVIFDPKLKDWSQNKWLIVRSWESKWDLAARYPHHSEAIISLDSTDALSLDEGWSETSLDNDAHDDGDLVAVYEFYHSKCDSVLPGRYTKFLNHGILLYDDVIPYRRLPVFRITPGERFDSGEGYSDAADMLAIQQMLNILVSTIASNQVAFGNHVIWFPDGCEFNPSQTGKGFSIAKGGPPGTEPRVITLLATPKEIFDNYQLLRSEMEKLIGINSVIRGEPEANLKSGAALGRMQAMAIQYASNFQRAWAELQEDVGTFLLELLQDYASNERFVALAGKFNKNTIAAFDSKKIALVDRVQVELGNPLSRTPAQRIEVAQDLLAQGLINAKQYFEVMTTGTLEPMLEAEESEITNIRKENERLMSGLPVKAIVGDAHVLHSREHKVLINDPNLRAKVAEGDQTAIGIMQQVLSHIQEHEQLSMTQSPFFAQIAGEAPPPPPPGPPPMPPPAGGPALEAEAPVGPQQPEGAPPIPPLPPEVQN